MTGGFRAAHPAVAMLYFAGMLLFAALLLHPVFLLTALLGLTALVLAQGLGPNLLRSLPFLGLTGVSVAVLNPLFSHRGSHLLFYSFDQPITLEAVLYGLLMMMVLWLVMVLFISYNATVTPDKFLYLFGGIAPQATLLLLMALRFVPLFQRRLRRITLIQRTRGIDVRHGSLRKRLRDGMTLLKVLLSLSLEEALDTADSMKARGYGVRKRSVYGIYKLDRLDRVALLLLAGCGITVAICQMSGFGAYELYPRMKPAVWGRGETLMYVCYCLFLLLPLALEGRERWIWRSSRRNNYPSGIRRQNVSRSTGSPSK
ncbi:energy-coupling factor transporter transmembrane component T [Paenibacillus sp. NFR01]|uniref:energy-coupling factor transporter transmembrane component T n=1 Tax=Paenibacillus sp. NFR01 TaxID=1566279 RepID=UPI0008AD14D3|nr:energy-coupling factor transporter transmembrane component T [Paenibacillus sp. NFR01]SEU01323.1 energy-coupling factor transport system permease protein [Paenibacillus sp. NFR01]